MNGKSCLWEEWGVEMNWVFVPVLMPPAASASRYWEGATEPLLTLSSSKQGSFIFLHHRKLSLLFSPSSWLVMAACVYVLLLCKVVSVAPFISCQSSSVPLDVSRPLPFSPPQELALDFLGDNPPFLSSKFCRAFHF